ncbi:MAG TPA: T9SS type A sorting domain-containing protein [Balneolales bacterium]|nr:T9SS type A sorting domain-containing protein [Balneolales bacterium]
MKKGTKRYLALLILVIGFASTAWSQVTKIRDARTMDGQTVTIRGIMNTADYGGSAAQFFVQDTTGGINIYDSGRSASGSFTLAAGDSLEITGSIATFSGVVELQVTSMTQINTGNPLPAPIMLNAKELTTTSKYQGMLVRVVGLTLNDASQWPQAGATSNGSVDAATADSAVTIYFDKDLPIIGTAAPTGEFNLTGVLTAYVTSTVSVSELMPSWANQLQNVYMVTINANTATVPDTLHESDFIQVRGYITHNGMPTDYAGQTLTWDMKSTPIGVNKGGDYWAIPVKMSPGDTLIYKFWVGIVTSKDTSGAAPSGGWESDGPVNGNYRFVLPDTAKNDHSTSVIFYNSGNGRNAPYVSKKDSVGIFFRVNVAKLMQLKNFNPLMDSIGVRGSVYPLNWDANAVNLDSEKVAAPGINMFYSGVAYFPKDSLTKANNTVEFKYYVKSQTSTTNWEGVSNRTFVLGAAGDTTIHWVHFNNEAPSANPIITTKLNFSVNVGILEGLGLFNSALDTMEVRGDFNGWADPPHDYLVYDGFSKTWQLNNKEVTKAVGDKLSYKYYVHWAAERFDSTSTNFILGIVPDNGYEVPGTWGGGNRVITIKDQAVQDITPGYFSGISPSGLITDQNTEGGNGINVTFKINMQPALSATTPFNPATDSVYMVVEEPMLALTQGWTPGESSITGAKTAASIEYIHFKPSQADPNVYELTINLKAKTLNVFAFRIWYGQPMDPAGTGVSNGGGFDPGRYYYQYIQPNVVNGQIQWPSSFTMATLNYQSDPPLPYELPPDYEKLLPISETKGADGLPTKFSLFQNYPNPFNPTTNITFAVPQTSNVELTIYNTLGQKVATLVSQKMSAGTHSIEFNATSLASGMYLYRLKAGNYVSIKKMMLIK